MHCNSCAQRRVASFGLQSFSQLGYSLQVARQRHAQSVQSHVRQSEAHEDAGERLMGVTAAKRCSARIMPSLLPSSRAVDRSCEPRGLAASAEAATELRQTLQSV